MIGGLAQCKFCVEVRVARFFSLVFLPPWALVGLPGLLWAGPAWALVGKALVGSPGPLWARPL